MLNQINWVKIGAVTLAAILLLNLGLYLFGRIAAVMFWGIIIAVGVYVFVVSPYLQEKKTFR